MTDKDIKERADHFRKECAEKNGDLKEDGGIAYTTIYWGNLPINITARSQNTLDAISELITAIKIAQDGFGIDIEREIPPVPAQVIQERDEIGTPVVDLEGKPVMQKLPVDQHIFSIKSVYHDMSKDGKKDLFKIVLDGDYAFGNGKYGIACFHPPSQYAGWKTWELKKEFAPMPDCGHVVVRDPQQGGKYAEIVEFRI
jgi:hypothetical protein